jgi:hypothetical protein
MSTVGETASHQQGLLLDAERPISPGCIVIWLPAYLSSARQSPAANRPGATLESGLRILSCTLWSKQALRLQSSGHRSARTASDRASRQRWPSSQAPAEGPQRRWPASSVRPAQSPDDRGSRPVAGRLISCAPQGRPAAEMSPSFGLRGVSWVRSRPTMAEDVRPRNLGSRQLATRGRGGRRRGR